MSVSFQPPADGPKDSLLLRLLRLGAVVVLGAWFLLLAAWLALHWLILPNIEQWRTPIEERASAALGINVKIGRIEVRSGGWVPAFELGDVALLDAQGREALHLQRVSAAVSARSLLHLAPRFEQLLIDAPTLEVRRDVNGRLSVAGFDMASDAGDGSAADWFFSQREFVIRGGALRWIDEQRSAQPVTFSDVQLVVRNTLRRHNLRLDATPPPELGERFAVRGRFSQALLARRGDWRQWSGTLYTSLPLVDVQALREHVSTPFELHQGRGALRAWVEFKEGRPMTATVDAALQAVTLRLGPSLDPLGLAEFSGRFDAARQADGVSLAAHKLSFRTDDGQVWPAGLVRLGLHQADDGQLGASLAPLTGGDFSADLLDLGVMAHLAARLPLPEAARHSLDDLAPQGEVRALRLQWNGPLENPSTYQLDAQATALALAARPPPSPAPHALGRPGLRNASIVVSANEKGGTAAFAMADGALDLPGVFDEPVVPFHSLDAQLAWRIAAGASADAPKVELDARNVRFANADASGRFDASWSTGAGSAAKGRGAHLPGVLDLQGQLDGGHALRVARYLPRDLPETARRYVEQAVRGGALPTVAFKVKGDMADFPASNAQQGEFRIAARVQDASLDFAPGQGWPLLTKIRGELVFDRNAMSIRDASGQLGALAVSGVNGGIANLADRSVLQLEGNSNASLSDGLALVNTTPIGGWIGHALAPTTGTGSAELKLGFEIPLDERPSTAKGSLTLAGSDLRLRPDLPMLRGARGRIAFTHDSFALEGIRAQVLGGDATLDGGLASDGVLRFSAQGVASAEGLRAATELPPLAALAASFSGQAPYRLALSGSLSQPEVLLTSTLQGLASDLPAPLKKMADGSLPLRLQIRPEPRGAADAGPLRDTLSVDLGNLAQARFVREFGSNGNVSRVLRGGIALGPGATAPTPASGVQALVQLPSFDADAWQNVMTRWDSPAASPRAASAAPSLYEPNTVALHLDALTVAGRRMTRVVAGLSRADNVWRSTVEADQLAGYAEWRGSADAPGQIYARLKRLSLPPSEADSVESMLESPSASQPALDIVIDDFTLRDTNLGRVEIRAEHRAAAEGAGYDWRLTKLAMTVPEAHLDASGQWLKPSAATQRRRSLIDLRLDVSDSGALLERLGTHGALRGGKGVLSGQLGWIGSPLSPDIASLSGTLEVSVASGQFLKAEPGAARLLGVLSLQALPRRLLLDFRDVFDQGFAFDSVAGNVRVDQGVAHTNNLRMRGVQAVVLMEGSADLIKETQDLRVIVVPEINAGTASLAYAVINPAIGLGTFLAQLVLRKPIIAAGTREFRVTGPWADAKVDVVPRALDAPVPDVDAAASAASAATK